MGRRVSIFAHACLWVCAVASHGVLETVVISRVSLRWVLHKVYGEPKVRGKRTETVFYGSSAFCFSQVSFSAVATAAMVPLAFSAAPDVAAAFVHLLLDAFARSGLLHQEWRSSVSVLFQAEGCSCYMGCSSLGSCACLPVLRRLCSLLRSGGFLSFREGLCIWFSAAASLYCCKHISTAAALVLVDTSDRLFSVSVAGARNAVLFLGFPEVLVCGLVLGLRIKGMRLVSLTSRIRSGVPARFWDLLQFDFAPIVGATLVLLIWWLWVRVSRLLAFTWWVRPAKLCAWGLLFLMQGWLITLFFLWWVVYEEAPPSASAWLLALLRVRHGRVLASTEYVFSVSCAAGHGASAAISL